MVILFVGPIWPFFKLKDAFVYELGERVKVKVQVLQLDLSFSKLVNDARLKLGIDRVILHLTLSHDSFLSYLFSIKYDLVFD